MKKHISLLLILCLVLSAFFPVFSMAEDIGNVGTETLENQNEQSTDISDSPESSPETELSPCPSDMVTPNPSEEVSASPLNDVSPSPSDEVSSNPTDASSPSSSEDTPLTPSDAATPCPSEIVVPSPLAEVSPSPVAETISGEALYNALMNFTDKADAEDFLWSLSDDELSALEEYASSLEPSFTEPPETVSVTEAGPLVSSVSKEYSALTDAGVMRLMDAQTLSLTTDTDGVELSKTASSNGNGTYTVRLESYTTGEVTTSTTGVPSDIVLVLDQSGSMAYGFNGERNVPYSNSRQKAMKDTVEGFIDLIALDKANNGSNHSIAVVTFASGLIDSFDFSNDYDSVKTTVENLSAPSGSTNVTAGMSEAYALLHGLPLDSGRNKVVIVFTDGVPTISTAFNTTVATNSIAISKSLKDMGATVYSIGIFNGASPLQLFGSKFDYDEHYFAEHQIASDLVCNGNYNEIWGASRQLYNKSDYDASFIDIAAGNRFLNYLSSNYSGASAIGIVAGNYNPGNFKNQDGPGYQIKLSFSRTTSYNYYLTAANTTDLARIFSTISGQIGSPDAELGSSVEVRDIISEYFDMPTTDIRVYTVACTAKTGDTCTWSDTETPFLGAIVTCDSITKIISVRGFAYDEEYVTEEEKPGGGHGSKLVICFELTARDDFWGGNGVPTNDSASGLFSGATLVEDFDIPTVDVPISVPFTAKSVNTYLGNTVALGDIYYPITEQTGADAWKDDFINVGTITYAATFSARPFEDQSPIIVTANVSPLISGTFGGIAETSDASITIYKPELTFCDSTIYLGESTNFADNLVSTDWKHGETDSVSVNMLGNAPILIYTYSPISGFLKEDTSVNVSVKVGTWDVTQYITFQNFSASHAQAPPDMEFTVFVEPCTLTVSKIGCNGSYGANQTFILQVTGTNLNGCAYADEVNLTFVVTGSSSKTIVGLPVGIYTITENSGWSWRYVASPASATLNCSSSTGATSIQNTLSNNLWLSGANWVQNVFRKKAEVSA